MNLHNDNTLHINSGSVGGSGGGIGSGYKNFEQSQEHKTLGKFYPSNHQMQTNSMGGANPTNPTSNKSSLPNANSRNNNKNSSQDDDKPAKTSDQHVSPKTGTIDPPTLGPTGSLKSDQFSTPKIPFPPLKDLDATATPESTLFDGGNSLLDILGPNTAHSRLSAKDQKQKHNLSSISKNKESAHKIPEYDYESSSKKLEGHAKPFNSSTAKKTPRKIIKKPPRKYSGMNEIHKVKKQDVISRIKPNKDESAKKQEMSEQEKHKEASNRIDYTDQPKWSGRYINSIFKGLSRDNSRNEVAAPNQGNALQVCLEKTVDRVSGSRKRSDYSKKGTIDVDLDSPLGSVSRSVSPVAKKKSKKSKKDKDKKKLARSRSRSRDDAKKKKKGDDGKRKKEKKEKKRKDKY